MQRLYYLDNLIFAYGMVKIYGVVLISQLFLCNFQQNIIFFNKNLTFSFHGRIYIIWTHKAGKFHEK